MFCLRLRIPIVSGTRSLERKAMLHVTTADPMHTRPALCQVQPAALQNTRSRQHLARPGRMQKLQHNRCCYLLGWCHACFALQAGGRGTGAGGFASRNPAWLSLCAAGPRHACRQAAAAGMQAGTVGLRAYQALSAADNGTQATAAADMHTCRDAAVMQARPVAWRWGDCLYTTTSP